jgi:fructose-1-phosphate kinase PfkB-like protein
MQSLNARGARWVVITAGSRPVWVSSATAVYRLRPPPAGPVVNAIGCGDAMAAAIAWATRNGRPLLDAVRLGIAAAAANLRQMFPCHFDPSRIEEDAARVEVDEL